MAARVRAACGAVIVCMMFPVEVPAMRSQDGAEAETLDEDAVAAGVTAEQVANFKGDPNLLGWIQEKGSEIGLMGTADLLLAKASWQARNFFSSSAKVFVKVGSTAPLHPVGSWRAATWAKTQQRKQAVLAAKSAILENGGRLSEKMIAETPGLEIMGSVSPFIAVPFDYCGVEYVVFEGNGRMKGMKLAAEEDPELEDMEVEVDLLQFRPDTLRWVHKGIQELWSQYIAEAEELRRSANATDPEVAKQIEEYSTFKRGVVKCRGDKGGPCSVEKEGEVVRYVQAWSLHGVSRAIAVPAPPGSARKGALKYKLCGSNEYILDNDLQTVKEYCPPCYNHVVLATP